MLDVRDIAASVDFYQRVMGLAFRGYWDPERSRFSLGDAPEGTRRRAELTAGDNRIELRERERAATPGAAEYVLEVDDLEVVHRRAAAGGTDVEPPRIDSTGARGFGVVDPDGHRWRLYQAAGG